MRSIFSLPLITLGAAGTVFGGILLYAEMTSPCGGPKQVFVPPLDECVMTRTEAIAEVQAESSLVRPIERAVAEVPDVSQVGILGLQDTIAERDVTIQKQAKQIAKLEAEVARLKAENEKRLVDEFHLFAKAEGVSPEATAILAEKVIPQLREVPTQWELQELAKRPVEILTEIDKTQGIYTGDVGEEGQVATPEQEKQAKLGLQRDKQCQELSRELKRILGPDRAPQWGSKGL